MRSLWYRWWTQWGRRTATMQAYIAKAERTFQALLTCLDPRTRHRLIRMLRHHDTHMACTPFARSHIGTFLEGLSHPPVSWTLLPYDNDAWTALVLAWGAQKGMRLQWSPRGAALWCQLTRRTDAMALTLINELQRARRSLITWVHVWTVARTLGWPVPMRPYRAALSHHTIWKFI